MAFIFSFTLLGYDYTAITYNEYIPKKN